MSHKLYSDALVELAKDKRFCCALERCTHQAKVSSPLCGDQLEIFLQMEGEQCVDVGFEAQACILCRASASVMGAQLLGRSIADSEKARESLEEAIATGDSAGPYQAFGVLNRFPSRHSCALLPWRALERALVHEEVRDPRPAAAQPALGNQASSLPQSAFEAIEGWRALGHQTVLATLVAVDGSSPSPLGSQMAISSTGAFWGSVSGGCVESAVVQAGLALMAKKEAASFERLRYRIANSQAGEVGLPCGGQIEVYLKKSPSSAHIQAWKTQAQSGQLGLRVFALDGREPLLLWDLQGSKLSQELPSRLVDQVQEGLDTPFLWKDESGLDYFVEPVRRAPPLLILGGTHVAQKLSALSLDLGFAPVIIEPREALAEPSRFPGAQVLLQGPQEALPSRLAPDAAVVMLTHNPLLDDPALEVALPSSAYYVGALGSRKTQRERLSRLAKAGVPSSQLDRLHGPVGLAIGAKGAGEIALSILAQVVQHRRQAGARKKIGAVVLAAGSSKRFGAANKLLAPCKGGRVLTQVVQRVLEAGLSPCMVVLGHQGEQVREALAGLDVHFVENPEHAQGMGHSVACGMRQMAKTKVDAAFVVLGDMPDVRVQDYEALAAAHRASTQHLIVAPESGRAQSRRLGNPILWPRRYFEELSQLQGDRGAKSLLLDAPGAVLRYYIDHPGVLRDVDRPGDLL